MMQKLKIALIQPEYEYSKKNKKVSPIHPPISLLSLHKDAEIYDLNVHKEPDYSKFDIVGVTAVSSNYKRAFEIIKKVKKHKCITILGGIHATSLPEETLKHCREIDILVQGEGEETFAELVAAFKKNKKIPKGRLSKIKGISFKVDGKIIHTKNRPLIKDLNKIDIYYNKINLADYKITPHHAIGAKYTKPSVVYNTSRGCPYNCVFCASKVMWGRSVRFFSADKVLKDINWFVKKNKIKNIDFYDDTFTLHPEFDKIMNGLKKHDLCFSCMTRVNVVTEEKIKKLKEAGCYMLRFGIESGNDEILKAIKKRITKDQARKALALCKKYKMRAHCTFMFGFPDETEETAQETIDFALELEPDLAFFFILVPLPKTEIEKEMIKENLIFANEVRGFNSPTTAIRTKHLSSEELIKIKKKAYRKFYFRPKYIIRAISKIRSINDVKKYWNGFRVIIN